MTRAEACLWKYALRASGLGVPFRRERPIGRYIADFVCLPLKLVIEVDGVTHLYEETQIKDAQKDKDLKEMGFEVLRFDDNVILNNINFVIGIIRDKIEELKENHPLNPPPAGKNCMIQGSDNLQIGGFPLLTGGSGWISPTSKGLLCQK